MDLFFWASFLKEKARDLRRVARATEGETSVEDLQSDAWIVAAEIGAKRGEPIDFTDPLDQDAIIAKLYIKRVLRSDKRLKYATRIDRDEESDEGENWSTQLRAADAPDPLEVLIEAENSRDLAKQERSLENTYSESAAYVIVLWHFHNNRGHVCGYLVIDRSTLNRRIDDAEDLVKLQPSLFDRIETIDESFMPERGNAYIARVKENRGMEQWEWTF